MFRMPNDVTVMCVVCTCCLVVVIGITANKFRVFRNALMRRD